MRKIDLSRTSALFMRLHGKAAIRTSVSLLATLLAAAAPRETQPVNAAMEQFYKCTETFLSSYDDRISPANLIAKAVANKCMVDALAWRRALVMTGMREDAANEIFQEAMRGDDVNIIWQVLSHRVARR